MAQSDHPGTSRPAAPTAQMSEEEFRALYEQLRGRLRWGPDDRRGPLNYLAPAGTRRLERGQAGALSFARRAGRARAHGGQSRSGPARDEVCARG